MLNQKYDILYKHSWKKKNKLKITLNCILDKYECKTYFKQCKVSLNIWKTQYSFMRNNTSTLNKFDLTLI